MDASQFSPMSRVRRGALRSTAGCGRGGLATCRVCRFSRERGVWPAGGAASVLVRWRETGRGGGECNVQVKLWQNNRRQGRKDDIGPKAVRCPL